MGTSYDPFEKARRLLEDKKVKKVGRKFFEVQGSKGEVHSVLFDHSKVSCTCTHYALHGARITRIKDNGVQEGYTKGNLCSHIYAAILLENKILDVQEEIKQREKQA